MIEDKKYKSVFMFYDSSKIDMNEFNKKTNLKYKIDKFTILFTILGSISLLLMLLTPFMIVVATIFYCLALSKRKKHKNAIQVEKLDLLERIIKKEEEKYEGSESISVVYPIYMICDNKNKEFRLIYQNIEYISVNYSDIINYEIFVDRTKAGKRLPDLPDPRMRSYIITLEFKDNKKAEIGFSNNNKYFLLDGKYSFLQTVNSKSINRLATTFDKIIKKSKV